MTGATAVAIQELSSGVRDQVQFVYDRTDALRELSTTKSPDPTISMRDGGTPMTARILRGQVCDAPRRQIERRGVLVDLCGDCHGVFLDRDERNKVLGPQPQAQTSGWSPPAAAEHAREPRRDDWESWSDDGDRDWRGRRNGGRERKRDDAASWMKSSTSTDRTTP